MLPMDLLGCPAKFQHVMEKLMDNISKVIVYIDDMLFHSQSHDDNIRKHTKECIKCHTTKSIKFPRVTPLQPMPQCSAPNQRIHMDLFRPCKTSDMGSKYILTITDAFTKYAKFFVIPNKEAETVVEMVFMKWICRYGCPSIIHTDGDK
jgi:hypothetical protein